MTHFDTALTPVTTWKTQDSGGYGPSVVDTNCHVGGQGAVVDSCGAHPGPAQHPFRDIPQ